MFLCSCCITDTGRDVEKAQEIVLEPQSFAARPESDDTFICSIKREGGEWGLICDSWGDCIQIVRVKGGKVKQYNDGVDASVQLTPGDIILQIDGKEANPQTLRELKDLAQAEFKVRRLVRDKVKVTKADSQKWGLKMSYQKGRSFCLRINSVSNEGAMEEHNLSADANSKIKDSDFILSANGCQQDPEKMLGLFKGCTEVDLTIMRMP